MKVKYIAILAGILSVAACTILEESFDEPSLGVVSFHAVNGDAQDTKTVLQSDGSLLWSANDKIDIFVGAQSFEFTGTNTSAVSEATFTGSLDGADWGSGKEYWAVYPHSANNSSDGSSITVCLPAEQEACVGTFAKDLFISIAKSQDYDLTFFNVCGGIKFSVTETGVESVTFKGNNGESIAGIAKVAFDQNGKPIVQEVTNPLNEVTLSAPAGTAFEVGKWYYIVCFPTVLENGYVMTLNKATGSVAVKKGDSAISIKRSTWGRLADMDKNLAYSVPNNEIWYTSVGNVVVDPYAASDWVQMDMIESNTMIDGIGKIVFKNDISDIPSQAFYSKLYSGPLKTVLLPNSVTRIHDKAFYGCSSLETVLVPEHLVEIGDYAFYKCHNLEGFVLPSSLLSLGVNVFTDCYSLRSLTLNTSASFHSYGLAYLLNGSSIETIQGPYATSDGKYAIINNAVTMAAGYNMTSAAIPSGVSSINPYVFYNNSSIKTVTIPESVNTIGAYSFYGCRSLDYITIENIAPPSIIDSFDKTNDCPILVPSQSVSAYKAVWPAYSLRIGATLDAIPISLSKNGTANSYIVNSAGSYRFSANRLGNSNSAINSITPGTPSTVVVLWESTLIPPEYSYNSYTYGHEPGTLISNIYYENEQIVFTATGNEGNALVALKNSSGTIMWSWHLWFVHEEINELATSSSLILMDRNLGAMKNEYGRIEPISGLLYQRGRKDPFVGGDSGLWNYQMTAVDNTTSIRNPTTLFGTNSGGWNTSPHGWYPKDMYDPCPPGWKIPQMSDFSGNWTFLYESTHYPASQVRSFSDVDGYYYDGISFPCAGRIFIVGNNESFVFREKATDGYYYLADGYYHFRADENSNDFYSQVFSGTNNNNASMAYSIRCCRE